VSADGNFVLLPFFPVFPYFFLYFVGYLDKDRISKHALIKTWYCCTEKEGRYMISHSVLGDTDFIHATRECFHFLVDGAPNADYVYLTSVTNPPLFSDVS
jgi:hypothetical protein